MRKFLWIAIPVFVIGFIAGNAFWYLASPLWIDRVVSEELPAELTLTVLSKGKFVDADGSHKGSGNAVMVKTGAGTEILQLSDFNVTNGPDLKVYLAVSPNVGNASDVLDGGWVSLGPLKGNIGDQNYIIPAEIDLSEYGSVVIWCQQFSVLFSSASLGESS